MKILLIEPAKAPITIGGEDTFLYEPLALEYLAAAVPDHDVRILDMRLDKDLESVVSGFAPDVVGITAYTVHVNVVRALCAQIKGWNRRILTVVGGHHASILPEDFCSPHIDLVVMGEGVTTFREIVRRFDAGRSPDWAGIPGLALARNGGMVKTAPTPIADLDVFPLPARRLTAAYRSRYFSEWMKPLASLRTSKGCPHRCKFCALWKMAGGRYLKRAPERILDELAAVDEQFVFFADDESLIDAPRMGTLAAMIRDAGLRKRFFLYARSDTIVRHPDLLEAWRRAGLERVFVGLEFFRDEDLADIRKGSTVRDNRRAVDILHDLDVEIYGSLIVHPDFTRPDFRALRQYCRDLGLSFPSFAVLTPLPGTDFYDEVAGRLLTRNYDYFDFIHTLLPTALPLQEFYAECYRLWTGAASPSQKLSLLKKMPLRDLPSLLSSGFRFYNRVRSAYRDY